MIFGRTVTSASPCYFCNTLWLRLVHTHLSSFGEGVCVWESVYVCARACVVKEKVFRFSLQKERTVSRKWRTRLGGLDRGSLLGAGAALLGQSFPRCNRQRYWESGRKDPAVGSTVWNKLGLSGEKRETEEDFHSHNRPHPLPSSFSSPRLLSVFSLGFAMGKEQELLEAARTGNLAAVEKLLSGKRQSAGAGSGLSGAIGSGNSGGHGASSHPLSSLLR